MSRREVEVPAKQSIFRCRVEEHRTWWGRSGWRYVIERMWSQIPLGMAREEYWGRYKVSPVMPSRDDAEKAGSRWLDEAEASNPDSGDYL